MTKGPVLRILECKECGSTVAQVDNIGNMIDPVMTCPTCDIARTEAYMVTGKRIIMDNGPLDASVFRLPSYLIPAIKAYIHS